MKASDHECPRVPTLHRMILVETGSVICKTCRVSGVRKSSAADVERMETRDRELGKWSNGGWLCVCEATVRWHNSEMPECASCKTRRPPMADTILPDLIVATQAVISQDSYVAPAATACQLHPQSYPWASSSGLRCAICGALLDGTQPPRESPLIRNLDTFQASAARTTGGWKNTDDRLLQAATGIASEAGEVLNEVRHIAFHGWPLDEEMKQNLTIELGDVMWGIAEAASALGVSLSEVATENSRKLEKRYPNGWDPAASMKGRR